ncbi:MAG TPA: ATP-grasp domain-containing protein [Pirellulaceae bacterium]|nr:ATP-grasp domain-containing protein [Pirellulaceae bacterium]HMO92435.1 ATP-grasp domain-containing protein [Pirellulaceae bacterium]HMP67895.1 ATP-grasp domain-containing protein [Pirellulaceae bacterium]
MKKKRILVLMHASLVPPETMDGYTEEEINEWKTEFDVVTTLRNIGHEVQPLGISDNLGVLRDGILEFKPHIAFNLLEEFHGVGVYDQHVVSYLELMKQHYTGCNPRGMLLSHDKALAKKILAFHRIRTPRFIVVSKGKKVRRGRDLQFPLLVKSVIEEASLGITEESIVYDDQQLKDRVAYVHGELETDAMVESYIEGRELYVGVLGNRRLTTFPVWELHFRKAPKGLPQIATARVKWDEAYQKKLGIETNAATDLEPDIERSIINTVKRVYRALNLSGYARMDLRLNDQGQVYVLEANPNPNLSYGEDFAESAEAAGISYEELLERIISLGMNYQAEWRLMEIR